MSTSLPRPVLLALLGAVAVAGVFLLTRGRGEEESVPATTAAPPAETADPAAAGSATAPTAPRSANPQPAAGAGEGRAVSRELPPRLERALDANKVVVLLFWSPRGVDDRSVKRAVDGLPRHGGKVAVFSDRLKNLGRYTKISAAANVVQTPTLLVTNRDGEARMATGYLDPTTVEQYVVDALHGAPK